jgi:hypothetical protein
MGDHMITGEPNKTDSRDYYRKVLSTDAKLSMEDKAVIIRDSITKQQHRQIIRDMKTLSDAYVEKGVLELKRLVLSKD